MVPLSQKFAEAILTKKSSAFMQNQVLAPWSNLLKEKSVTQSPSQSQQRQTKCTQTNNSCCRKVSGKHWRISDKNMARYLHEPPRSSDLFPEMGKVLQIVVVCFCLFFHVFLVHFNPLSLSKFLPMLTRSSKFEIEILKLKPKNRKSKHLYKCSHQCEW